MVISSLDFSTAPLDEEYCDMQESGFDLAKIKNSKFLNCNLERATFGETDLSECDFTTAYNFAINPSNCKLKKAKFNRQDLSGLVAHLDIVLIRKASSFEPALFLPDFFGQREHLHIQAIHSLRLFGS